MIRREDREAIEDAGYARIVDRAMAPLEARIEDLEVAMREIAAPTDGTEIHDTAEERAEIYWRHIARLQAIARRALTNQT